MRFSSKTTEHKYANERESGILLEQGWNHRRHIGKRQ